jgi:hypothetical protein
MSQVSTQLAPLAVSGNGVSKVTPLFLPVQRKRQVYLILIRKEFLQNSLRTLVFVGHCAQHVAVCSKCDVLVRCC